MFCSNCGSKIDDGSLFCPNCGTRRSTDPASQPEPTPVQPGLKREFTPTPPVFPTEPAQPTVAPQPAEPMYAPEQSAEPAAPRKKLNRKVLIGILAGAVAVAVLVVLLIVLLGGKGGAQNSWKDAYEKVMEAEKTYDLQTMIEVSMPDEVLDAVLNERGMSKSDFNSAMKAAQAQLDVETSSAGYKEYIDSFEYSITGNEPMSKEEVDELNDYYNDRFETGSNYISEGMVVTVHYKVGAYDYEGDEELDFVKIGNKWYVSVRNIDLPTNMIFR